MDTGPETAYRVNGCFYTLSSMRWHGYSTRYSKFIQFPGSLLELTKHCCVCLFGWVVGADKGKVHLATGNIYLYIIWRADSKGKSI